MASKKELDAELKIALKEVGEITPWYDKRMKTWLFSNELYPVECEGSTAEEVIKKYPLYLRDFIEERMKDNLAPFVAKKTKGHGGYRPGAGRPKGTTSEPKLRVYLPEDVAHWIQIPEHLLMVKHLVRKCC